MMSTRSTSRGARGARAIKKNPATIIDPATKIDPANTTIKPRHEPDSRDKNLFLVGDGRKGGEPAPHMAYVFPPVPAWKKCLGIDCCLGISAVRNHYPKHSLPEDAVLMRESDRDQLVRSLQGEWDVFGADKRTQAQIINGVYNYDTYHEDEKHISFQKITVEGLTMAVSKQNTQMSRNRPRHETSSQAEYRRSRVQKQEFQFATSKQNPDKIYVDAWGSYFLTQGLLLTEGKDGLPTADKKVTLVNGVGVRQKVNWIRRDGFKTAEEEEGQQDSDERLATLKKMHDQGPISSVEFENFEKKKKVLL